MNCATNMNQYHYDMGFQDGYMACKNEYKKKAKDHREQQIKARERFLYFLKQKLLGVVALALTVAFTWLLDGDATVGIIMIPLGLTLIFSNKPIVYGKYYWEQEEY
ncbi:MAG: hypothetical protein OSJ61_00110 [Lachnospiraceae bacterium]|nr:hypothetical protein [Lachnospiraceae bacterium]